MLFLLIGITSLILLVYTCSLDEGNSRPMKEIASLAKTSELEDLLDLGMHPVDTFSATALIDSSLILLKLDGSTSMNKLMNEPDSAVIHQLRDSALSLHVSAHANQGFVTGVRLWFTLNNSTINCLFEPVCLYSSDTGSVRTYSITSNQRLFYLENHNLMTADSIHLARMSDYYQGIRFKDDPSVNSYRTFISSTENRGDVRSLLYSFQEIDSVMLNNSSVSVKLWSYAYRLRINDTIRSRQGIMLSPAAYSNGSKSNPEKIRLSFKGRLADRANPCPPECDQVSFRVLR